MQRNLTWSLFAAALGLFAVIYFFERKLPGSAERQQPKRVLPIANAGEIQSIEVTLPPNAVIRAQKTNGLWVLTEPRYPAKQVALDTFATNIADLRALDRVPPHEVKLQGDKSFGLAPPRAVVSVNSSSNSFELEIGGTAPITSNLYVRLPRSGEVVLASPSLLETLPRGTNDWRTPALFQLSSRDFDHIEIKAGQRSFELGRGTNSAWQIAKPVPARADQDRVLELLQALRSVEAQGFVTDTPGADLERFGLQNPEVEVNFAADTNRLYALDFGGSPTNQTNLVFTMLIAPGHTNVVLAPRALAEFLKQPYKAYHDPRLVTIAAGALDRIVVHAAEDFTLQRQPNGAWLEDKTKMPVDPALFSKFVTAAGGLRIVDIVKEVPTETDLKTFGFLPPAASFSFFQKLTNTTGVTTNILFTDVTFGRVQTPQTDTVAVRRSDENPIYLTPLASLIELPKHAFELRDRKIWRFDTNALLRISISAGQMTNTIARTSGWATDPILSAQIDEIAFRLSRLDALEWVEKGAKRLATFGITESSPTLALQLRDEKPEENYSLRFGRQTLRHDVYAAVRFPGDREPSIFEFPGDTYQLMLQSLPFPK